MTLQTFAANRSACTWDDFPERWRAVVGPQLALVTRPAALTYDGALTIVVASRDWLPDLFALRTTILGVLPTRIENISPRAIHLRVVQV
jgi:predicted nucleic acid-binding Zn ribbon protein